MNIYFDTCVLVSLFINDAWSRQARTLIDAAETEFLVSDFGRLEFASALSGRVRAAPSDRALAQAAFAAFDSWSARLTTKIETTPADLIAAEATIRRLDTPLRTGDALHIAIADRVGAAIATFDHKLTEAARSLGVPTLT